MSKTQDDITDIINKMWEEYELTPNAVQDYKKPDNVALTQKKVNNLRKDLREKKSHLRTIRDGIRHLNLKKLKLNKIREKECD